MAFRRRPVNEASRAQRLEVDASMSGTLRFKDLVNLQINGRFEGTLETKGNLTIGEHARVQASIHGEEVVVNGTVDGTITAFVRVELSATARVVGKISSPKLIVHEGAVFHGTSEMIASPRPEPQWLTAEELASYLEVEAPTVVGWAKAGRLPAQHEGGQWRFNRQQVEEWLAQEKIRNPQA